MKLDEHMRYPHPVLSEYSDDYVSGEFRCAFEQSMTAGGELRLVANLEITNSHIAALVTEQAASVGYFVVCRRTYFNQLQEASFGQSEKFFDANRLFGTVVLRPVVWTRRKVEGFRSSLFDSEFGDSVTISKGSVIALGPEFRFSMDPKKYKPFDSIFELAISEGVAPNTIAVDHDQDRITILACQATYRSIADIRGMNRGKDMILNTVYLPAIIEVIARLQVGGINVEGRKWFRVFKAKCDDAGVNPADPNVSPVKLAQDLLRGPLRKTISLMESLG